LINQVHQRSPDQYVLRDGNYVIVGLGGVGTWVATAIVLSTRNPSLTIIDNDELEVHNMNRLPYPIWFEGMKKVDAFLEWLSLLRMCDIVKIDTRLSHDNIDDLLPIILSHLPINAVVDATDSPLSIALAKKLAMKLGVPYLGLHYDGDNFTIEWRPRISSDGDWVLDENAGYTVFPSTVMVPYLLASLAIYILATRPDRDIVISSSMPQLFQSLTQT